MNCIRVDKPTMASTVGKFSFVGVYIDCVIVSEVVQQPHVLHHDYHSYCIYFIMLVMWLYFCLDLLPIHLVYLLLLMLDVLLFFILFCFTCMWYNVYLWSFLTFVALYVSIIELLVQAVWAIVVGYFLLQVLCK